MMDSHNQSPFFQSAHFSAQRLSAIVISCFDPVFEPETFKYLLSNSTALQVICTKWGDLGQLVCENFPPENNQIHFESPLSISTEELPKYESRLRKEVLGLRGRLADLLGQKDVFQNILSQALYEKRMQRHQEFKAWLFSRLQIFGYRDLFLDPILITFTKVDEHFDFPIKGTPAQFGVMLRQFAQTLRTQNHFQDLASQVLLPGNRKDTGNIPPDVNPIEVRLSLGKTFLSIYAHVLPLDGTLLRIHLSGEKDIWELWDRVRDELEKLGWFSLPELPTFSGPVETIPEPQIQAADPAAEIWTNIPNIGPNREILRHWHKGLTCEQIGTRVSLSEKTVNNRIHQLRKEFGTLIVPYRKSNYLKNPREKTS